MKYILFITLSLALSACGGDSGDSSASNAKQSSASKSSSLKAFLSEEKVCEVLSKEDLNSLSDGAEPIKTTVYSFRKNFNCTFDWPRPDAEEREKNMLAQTMAAMTGNGPKMTLRDRMMEYQVSVGIEQTKRLAANFVPRKLSEAEMDAQIAAAKQRAAERLTDEQKEIAGDAANKMMESMLRKNNQNTEVTGVGDAAYWSDLATGSLMVLDGDVQISIAPMMADTKQEDIENAKKVARMLLD